MENTKPQVFVATGTWAKPRDLPPSPVIIASGGGGGSAGVLTSGRQDAGKTYRYPLTTNPLR